MIGRLLISSWSVTGVTAGNCAGPQRVLTQLELLGRPPPPSHDQGHIVDNTDSANFHPCTALNSIKLYGQSALSEIPAPTFLRHTFTHRRLLINQFSDLMLPAERDGQPAPEPVLVGHVPLQEQGLSVPGQGYDRTMDSYKGNITIKPDHEGLQSDQSQFLSGGTSADEQVGTAPAVVTKTEKELTTSLSPPGKPRRRRRLIFVVIALTLVITAAIIGGVLGSRTAGGSTNTSPSASPSATNPPNTTTDTSSLIKQQSGLSVAAWRKSQGGLQILLYYQSLDGTLRWSTYDDPHNESTYSSSYWGESKPLGDADSDQAANDTGLAAAMILWDTNYMVSDFRVQ